MPENRWNRNDLIALLVALALHAVLLAVLLFIVLPAAELRERGGILVNIGDVEFASGAPSPNPFQPVADASLPMPEEQVEEPLLTQDNPEAPAIETPRDNTPTPEELEAQRRREAQRQEEQRRQAAEEEARRKREEIAQTVSGAFGNAASRDAGSGNTPGAPSVGKEGSSEGNVPSGGANTGVGGFGSYDLSGRSISGAGLPRPSYNAQVEGTIRIQITVDPSGKVISTNIAPGTTIDNYQLRQGALRAAALARFNAIDGYNNQVGYITYRYQLR